MRCVWCVCGVCVWGVWFVCLGSVFGLCVWGVCLGCVFGLCDVSLIDLIDLGGSAVPGKPAFVYRAWGRCVCTVWQDVLLRLEGVGDSLTSIDELDLTGCVPVGGCPSVMCGGFVCVPRAAECAPPPLSCPRCTAHPRIVLLLRGGRVGAAFARMCRRRPPGQCAAGVFTQAGGLVHADHPDFAGAGCSGTRLGAPPL